MLKIALILLASVSFAFSDIPGVDSVDWANDTFPVMVYGDSASVADSFQVAAMLFQTWSDGSFFHYIMVIAFVVLFIRMALRYRDGDFVGGAKEFVWLFALLILFLSPIAKVNIVDKRFDSLNAFMTPPPSSDAAYVSPVANIPYALAVIASGTSMLRTELMRMTNNVLGTTYDFSTVQGRGFGKSYEDIKKMLNAAETSYMTRDTNATLFTNNMSTYISECVFPTIYSTPANRVKVLNPQYSYLEELKPSSINVDDNDLTRDGQGCLTFWNDKVLAYESGYQTHTDNMWAGIYSPESNASLFLPSSASAVMTSANGAVKMFDANAINNIGGMQKAMREAAITSVIRKTTYDNNALAGFDSATALVSEKSKQSMLSDGISSLSWMMEMIPLFQHWMMVLVVLLYFPMMLVTLFKPVMGAIMTIVSYAWGFLSFQMLDVILEVVQYLTNIWGGKEALSLYAASNQGQPFSVANIASTVDYVTSMSAIAGTFGVASMALIGGIITKGQVGNITGLAGNLKGMFQGNVLANGAAGFTEDMAAREHEDAQNRMRKDKMNALSGSGFGTGDSSFETDKLYAQMQSEMASASKGAAMHNAVNQGESGEVASSMGYKAESAIQAEIAYAEVLETGAGSPAAALENASKTGEIAGSSAAHSELATVESFNKTGGKDGEDYYDGVRKQAGMKVAETSGLGAEGSFGDALTTSYQKGRETGRAQQEGAAVLEQGRTRGELKSELGMLQMKGSKTDSDLDRISSLKSVLGSMKGDFVTNADLKVDSAGFKSAKDTMMGATHGLFGSLEASKAAGGVAGMMEAGADFGAKNVQALDENGKIRLGSDEANGLFRGAEIGNRSKLNQTIGTGKADLGTDEHQYMAYLQDTSAVNTVSAGIEGKANRDMALNNADTNGDGFQDKLSLKSDYGVGVETDKKMSIASTRSADYVYDSGSKISSDQMVRAKLYSAAQGRMKDTLTADAQKSIAGVKNDKTVSIGEAGESNSPSTKMPTWDKAVAPTMEAVKHLPVKKSISSQTKKDLYTAPKSETDAFMQTMASGVAQGQKYVFKGGKAKIKDGLFVPGSSASCSSSVTTALKATNGVNLGGGTQYQMANKKGVPAKRNAQGHWEKGAVLIAKNKGQGNGSGYHEMVADGKGGVYHYANTKRGAVHDSTEGGRNIISARKYTSDTKPVNGDRNASHAFAGAGMGASRTGTYSSAVTNQALADTQSFMGSGTASGMNMAASPGIYASNAFFGERTKALSTAAAISEQGGLDKAIGTSVMGARMQARGQQDALTSNMSALLMNGEMKLDKASADAMANKLISGAGTFGGTAGSAIAAAMMSTAGTFNKASEFQKSTENIGSAKTAMNQIDKDPNVFRDVAEYGSESKIETTKAKLDTLGGKDKAVSQDVSAATLKTIKEKATTDQELDQHAKDAGGSAPLTSAQIKSGETKPSQVAKAINESGIGDSVQHVTSGQSGAKVASGIKEVREFSSVGEMVQSAERVSIQQTAPKKVANEFMNDTSKLNKVVAEERKQHRANGTEKEYLEGGKKYGFLNDKGEAVGGEDWARGRAVFQSSGMDRNEQGNIGGVRMSTSTNMLTGESITNIDGKRMTEAGTVFNANSNAPVNKKQALAADTAAVMTSPVEMAKQMAIKASGDMPVDLPNGVVPLSKDNEERPGIMESLNLGHAGAAVIGGVAVNTLSKKVAGDKPLTLDKMKGHKVLDGQHYDAEGRAFDVNDKNQVVRDGEVVKTPSSVKKHGVIGAGVRGISDTLTTSTDKLRGIDNEASGDTQDSSTNKDGSKDKSTSNQSMDKKVSHNAPLNNLDNTIVPQKPETPKMLNVDSGNLSTPSGTAKEIAKIQAQSPGQVGAKSFNDKISQELSRSDISPEKRENLESLRNKLQSNNPMNPVTDYDLKKAGMGGSVPTKQVTTSWEDKKSGEMKNSTKAVADFTQHGTNIKNDAVASLTKHGNALTEHNRNVQPDSTSNSTQDTVDGGNPKGQDAISKINEIPNDKVGKAMASTEISAAKKNATPEQRKALDKMQTAINSGGEVSADMAKEAGLGDRFDTKDGNVDMETYGEKMKGKMTQAIETSGSGGNMRPVKITAGGVLAVAGSALLLAQGAEYIKNGNYEGLVQDMAMSGMENSKEVRSEGLKFQETGDMKALAGTVGGGIGGTVDMLLNTPATIGGLVSAVPSLFNGDAEKSGGFMNVASKNIQAIQGVIGKSTVGNDFIEMYGSEGSMYNSTPSENVTNRQIKENSPKEADSGVNPNSERFNIGNKPETKADYEAGSEVIANGLGGIEKTESQKIESDKVTRKLEKGEPITSQELVSAGAPKSAVDNLPTDDNNNINVARIGQEQAFYQSVKDNQGKAPTTSTMSAVAAIEMARSSEGTAIDIPAPRAGNNEAPASAGSVNTSRELAGKGHESSGSEEMARAMDVATNMQAGTMAVASLMPSSSQPQAIEIMMNSGNIAPNSLSDLGLNSEIAQQMQAQFPAENGAIDVSAIGASMQATASASIQQQKLGNTSVDNADLMNAMGAGQANFEGLNSIIEQRAGSTGVQLQTADGPAMLSRNAKDEIMLGGQALEGTNFQDFRQALSESSPADQNNFASMIAQAPLENLASTMSANASSQWDGGDSWQTDGTHMMDISQRARVGNEDNRSGFMDVTFALEEMGEDMREMMKNMLKNEER